MRAVPLHPSCTFLLFGPQYPPLQPEHFTSPEPRQSLQVRFCGAEEEEEEELEEEDGVESSSSFCPPLPPHSLHLAFPVPPHDLCTFWLFTPQRPPLQPPQRTSPLPRQLWHERAEEAEEEEAAAAAAGAREGGAEAETPPAPDVTGAAPRGRRVWRGTHTTHMCPLRSSAPLNTALHSGHLYAWQTTRWSDMCGGWYQSRQKGQSL